ncbi:Protein HEADING DATE 3A, partial [Dichanthelium oligosanthes]
LDTFTSTVPLRITYNNRLLLAGAELKPSAVVSKPRVDIGGNDMRAFYTLVLIDPDAPSPSHPSLKEYLHWMVTDIPETTSVSFGMNVYSDLLFHFISSEFCSCGGHELVFYERPEPRSGIHRMIFVLFRQLGRGTVFAPEMRHNFNCRSFAQQYHLNIATATYFNCQREAGSGGRRFRDE